MFDEKLSNAARSLAGVLTPETLAMVDRIVGGKNNAREALKYAQEIPIQEYAPAGFEQASWGAAGVGMPVVSAGLSGAGDLSTLIGKNPSKETIAPVLGRAALKIALSLLLKKKFGPKAEKAVAGPDIVQSPTRNWFTGEIQALGDKSGNLPRIPIPNVNSPLQSVAERIVKDGVPTNLTTQMLNLVTKR